MGFAIALFFAGNWIARNSLSVRRLLPWFGVALAGAVPALLFAAYYTHLFDNAVWFYTFRAAPFTELSAAGIGFGPGLIAGIVQRRLLQNTSSAFQGIILRLLLFCVGLILLVPYAKPLLSPLRIDLHDEWRDGVCIQSTPSTCGPASAATLLRHFGRTATERELARECFSYGGGTENWYIVRALRRRGLNVQYVIGPTQPASLPFPSIAGTELGGPGGAGHFVAILGQQNGRYLVGDPLVGRLLLTPNELRSRYYLTGFFLVVRERDLTEAS